ncbi:MAG TPA: hypothetical protein DEO88_12170 [Syntrophobacteraceae bacterium]|nr:hypothetical protein [Syntrophobacteraceae bacterium]
MKHHSILVVDDGQVFARNWTKLLTHRGNKAAYVLNGSAAIAELDRGIPRPFGTHIDEQGIKDGLRRSIQSFKIFGFLMVLIW